jgi:hypothetical protein
MSARALPDLIDGYIEFSKNTESPSNYHLWSAISVISGTMQRKTWLKWGHTDIYPNQYIILVGPSGNRKGEPLIIARNFLREIGVHLISEAITREALIRSMKKVGNTFTYKKLQITQCPLTGVFEEFAVFLGDGDTKMLAAMTNWYDSRERWTYETKGAGTDEITGVCMNVLGSMAPDWIPVVIPMSAIGGGFTSRIIWIVEHKKGRIIEDPNDTQIDRKLEQAVKHDLSQVANLRGPFTFQRDALDLYKTWYRETEEAAEKGKHAISDPRFAGYNSRRATHIKKVAIACCASRGDTMLITAADFLRAKKLLLSAEEHMPSVFRSIGRSQYGQQTDTVLDFIRTRSPVNRSDVLKVLYYDIDVKTMEVVEQNLVSMGRIKIIGRDMKTGDVTYKWMSG